MRAPARPAAALLLALLAGAAGAAGLAPGDRAPDFEAIDADSKTHVLSSHRGVERVVLYFYPKDETPGCTREACAFRDDWERFRALDTQVYGVSLDDAASHRRFASKHDLPFPLLVDPDGHIAALYGVPHRGAVLNRSTVVVDRRGIVRLVDHEVDITSQNARLLEFLAGLDDGASP
jgi:peroxiredoxin Q/BCP